MKKVLVSVGLAVGLLWFSNPDLEDFRPFVRDVARAEIEEATGGGTLGRVLGGAGSELVASHIDRITTRRSYVVCSIYRVDVDGDGTPEWEFLGIATRFITLEHPDRRERDG
jgi:hypothetical protein